MQLFDNFASFESSAFAQTISDPGTVPAKTFDKKPIYLLRYEDRSTTVLRWDEGKGDGELLQANRRITRNMADSELESRQLLTLRRIQFSNGQPKNIWTIEDETDRFRHLKDLSALSTTSDGCCGKMNSHRLFDFNTGAFLFPSTLPAADQPVVFLEHGDPVFVGFQDTYWGARDSIGTVAKEGDKVQLFGILSFASRTGVQQVAVYHDVWDDPGAQPDVMQILTPGGKTVVTATDEPKKNTDASLTYSSEPTISEASLKHTLVLE
jgi:hypothetical protein